MAAGPIWPSVARAQSRVTAEACVRSATNRGAEMLAEMVLARTNEALARFLSEAASSARTAIKRSATLASASGPNAQTAWIAARRGSQSA